MLHFNSSAIQIPARKKQNRGSAAGAWSKAVRAAVVYATKDKQK
jgi:hypothetical protein